MRNVLWERWGPAGILFGIWFFIFGLLIQGLEIARIYRGPANRGAVNFSKHQGLRPSFLFDGNQFSIINQRDTMWPWSFPGIWFGILSCATGVMAIVASLRRTYGSVLGFSVLSLVMSFMAVFLYAYYAIIIHFYNSRHNKSWPYTGSEKEASRLSKAVLSFVVFDGALAMLATLVTALTIGACTPKGRFGRGPVRGPRGPRPVVYVRGPRPTPIRPF